MLAAIHPQPEPIPDHLVTELAPAEYWVSEWGDGLGFDTNGGAEWFIAGTRLETKAFGHCRHRFENRVGLCRIERLLDGRRDALMVEVLSTKAPLPEDHLKLFRDLEDDIHRRCAALAFTFEGDTARGLSEALKPPTPLFTLHFATHYAPELVQALHTIAKSPYRLLRDRDDWVPVGLASDVDADTLLAIAHHPEHLVACDRLPSAKLLRGKAPTRVWQRLPEETFDTPENRFARAFCESLGAAVDALPRQPWWGNVAEGKRQAITRLRGVLTESLRAEPLVDAGPLRRLPFGSQVLLRRDGYRELRALWQRFQSARRPLFGALSEALELRDVATLYEMWVFFKLVDELAEVTGEEPVINVEPELRRGLDQTATASFGAAGRLLYNHGRDGYSGRLKPDFLWRASDGDRVALDAKFRMRPDEVAGENVAKRADLDKMHTYRDALGLAAAVCVYPGDVSRFYRADGAPAGEVGVRDVIGGLSGVGALARRPGEG